MNVHNQDFFHQIYRFGKKCHLFSLPAGKECHIFGGLYAYDRDTFSNLSTKKETKMFTVLSTTRKTNLYLIIALAIMLVMLLTFAVAPSIAAPKPALIPVTGISESPDYYQRHPELRLLAGVAVDVNGDFALRHPEWVRREQNVEIPVTGISESLDYFQRHLDQSLPTAITIDNSDYFARHPESRTPAQSKDLSDYFLRH